MPEVGWVARQARSVPPPELPVAATRHDATRCHVTVRCYTARHEEVPRAASPERRGAGGARVARWSHRSPRSCGADASGPGRDRAATTDGPGPGLTRPPVGTAAAAPQPQAPLAPAPPRQPFSARGRCGPRRRRAGRPAIRRVSSGSGRTAPAAGSPPETLRWRVMGGRGSGGRQVQQCQRWRAVSGRSCSSGGGGGGGGGGDIWQ
jgi:hypothetical protein